MKFKVLTIVFFCLTLMNAQGQRKYSTSNTRSIRAYENAKVSAEEHNDKKAIEELSDILTYDSNFVESYLLLANIYTDQGEFDKARKNYSKAVSINPDFFPKALFTLGELEFKAGEYENARGHLEKFLTYKNMTSQLKSKGKTLLDNSMFAVEAIKHPVPFNPLNLGDSINTPMNEYFPAITADGSTFLFTRRINAQGGTYMQEDFFVSHLVNKNWTKAAPVDEINTEGNEGAPSLSADGQYLFFTTCPQFDEYPTGRKGHGSCDIYLAKKMGSSWKKPRNLDAPLNSGSWESQPSFSSDGRTLYFVRADGGSNEFASKDYNIYVTHITDSSGWTEPEKLSDKINTPGSEQSVYIHPDNKTLYFSSDGHPGMGGLDIFMSRRQPDGEWGEPVNLGYPINTSADENSILVGPSGDIAYFASNRPGGKGGLDLYSFALYDSIKAQKISYLKGHVMDAETKAPLASSFQLIDLASGKTVVSSTSNPGNGEFLVVLPAGMNYALNVSKDGYLFYSEHFEMKEAASADKPYSKDILMKPIKVGASVVLNNIFFETAKFNLKPESKFELNKVVGFMKANSKVKMEISGHTDNVGADQANQLLSENRAKAVFDYLVSNGIPASRLTYKGYGETKPVADNNTEAGRAQNRRTEFTVLSVN